MKRPPGLWILLSAGVLWLNLQDVYGIRATALIFGKSSTTTTTTEALPENTNDETATIATNTTSSETLNSTKPTLTGNPQIDYVWDPNLPQELNGYNLSEYPFYERVPEEIDFKCDGLHDGFYASVTHKCQVYHHCLFGTRYDFLCANYTAFDQKTFICHFASEVDCVNSKKFWHRNDALYKAESTTTVRPINLNIYTTAPPLGTPVTPLVAAIAPRRPAGGRRPYRPNRRRRPQFEYYDDEYYDDEYYEERPRATRGRKRQRPRPRPVYEDEEYDEEYEDDRYERRGNNRRRPYERRQNDRKRNKDRRKPEYDDDEVEEHFEDEDYLPERRKTGGKRKNVNEEEEDRVETKRTKDKDSDKRRPSEDRSKTTRKGPRRPPKNDYEDDATPTDDNQSYDDRPSKKEKPSEDTNRPVIKPVSGTIYDRPRVAPRINLPVPKNAADKFAYKPMGGKPIHSSSSSPPPPKAEEEYYEDYEEEPLSQAKNSKKSNKSSTEVSVDKPKNRETVTDTRKQTAFSRNRPRRPDSEEEPLQRPKYNSNRSKFVPNRTTPSYRKKPTAPEEYDEDYEEEGNVKDAPLAKNEKYSTTTSTTTTTTEASQERHEPIVRIVKRPFLPSRGGNPYSPRGLQPVGTKALDRKPEISEEVQESTQQHEDRRGYKIPVKEEDVEIEEDVRKPSFKPSPTVIKIPVRNKFVPTAEAQEIFDSESSRPRTEIRQNFKEHSGHRTTQKPKIIEKNPLDLNEYDVTLNDALNPTLPNLPVRAFPTGFGSGNDYAYNNYQRPRYVLEPVISQTSSDYVYQKPTRQQVRFEAVPQSHAREQFTSPGQYTSSLNGNYRRRDTQTRQTQALYSSF